MNTHDFKNKLQQAYHAMVDMINISVEVEEKSVDEAIEIAKKKLSEWEDLSAQEIEDISTEIKLDLTSLVETLAEAKHAYGEQLALDTLYLKERSLEKLKQIADKTTLELSEFNRDLKERVQIVSEEQFEHEHQQHQQWESEHAMWLDDIAIWQKEYLQMEEALYAIKEGIYKQKLLIEKHAKAIQIHQAKDHQHEIDMAATEQGEIGADKHLDNDQETHEKSQNTHQKQSKLHDKIKQKQKDIMVLIAKLTKIIS